MGYKRENEVQSLGCAQTEYVDSYAPEVLETFENKPPDVGDFVKMNAP